MKKVVVTGANGFVGSALCKELAENGIEVIAVVRNENANIDNIKNVEKLSVIYCDISDFRNLSQYIKCRDIDVLFHLAWVGSAGEQRENVDIQLKNVQYACDTVKACGDLGCKKFIFASSIMEYEIEKLMETEQTPRLNTLYSTAKITADYMTRAIAGSIGVEYIRTIISNIYGPGEISPRLINTSLRKMIRGEHCAFSSGEQMYDFIYITDAAKAFVEISKKGISNRTYYIGSQNPRPLKIFLEEMRDYVNPNIKIGLGELKFEGVSLTYKEFDINAIVKDTGFEPQVSFEEGIKKTINWIKEND